MDAWGVITYPESSLVYEVGEFSTASLLLLTTTMSQHMAHQVSSEINTGLVSVSFPSTAHWRSGPDCCIIQMGGNREKHLDNFSWGEVPNSVIKYFICLEYNKF